MILSGMIPKNSKPRFPVRGGGRGRWMRAGRGWRRGMGEGDGRGRRVRGQEKTEGYNPQ